MSFFDGIDFFVKDAANDASAAMKAVGAGAAAGAAAAGAGVTMDRDEMTSFLTQVKQTRELCQQQVDSSRFPPALSAPADDPASAMFTNAAVASREGRNKYLNDQLNMYNELIDKLEQALGLTTESDQQAAHIVNQAAGGGKY